MIQKIMVFTQNEVSYNSKGRSIKRSLKFLLAICKFFSVGHGHPKEYPNFLLTNSDGPMGLTTQQSAEIRKIPSGHLQSWVKIVRISERYLESIPISKAIYC